MQKKYKRCWQRFLIFLNPPRAQDLLVFCEIYQQLAPPRHHFHWSRTPKISLSSLQHGQDIFFISQAKHGQDIYPAWTSFFVYPAWLYLFFIYPAWMYLFHLSSMDVSFFSSIQHGCIFFSSVQHGCIFFFSSIQHGHIFFFIYPAWMYLFHLYSMDVPFLFIYPAWMFFFICTECLRHLFHPSSRTPLLFNLSSMDMFWSIQ